jgi:hypothetical protein
MPREHIMIAEKQPVRLAGAELHRHCHACALFNSQDEEYRLLVPFAKEGYDRGEHVFHISRFSAAVVVGILRTHPLVIIGGLLHENPFFVPPEEFLKELRQRTVSASPN